MEPDAALAPLELPLVAAAVMLMLMDPLLLPLAVIEPELEPELPDAPAFPPAPLRPVGCSPGAHVAELGSVTSALEMG